MVNKGFPKFGMSQAGSFVAALKNYNLPDFILVLIAKECKSELLERGRIDDRLQSMNDDALHLLHKIFVDCEEDDAGKFAQYRFFAYVSSMYHKCEVLVNETIPGQSGKNHKILVAVKNNGMYISVAQNKATGNPVNKKETNRFYEMVDDIKKGDHGTMLTDAVYGSSVGFRPDALLELKELSKSRDNDPENKLDFKTANFENNIYSVTKC
ncbi:MAG: hypothetical protein L7R82_00600 [Nitrosopumilus sp.]|jgi:hypothetical protein|uniref:Uncharacterized protein n=2 Tax=environmental samples TaxID=651140 RepID=A0A075HNI7_9ARCH|nr:hypothetical protein [Nitrosopumilus sp.]AIF15518.1 hypothetical protein [uncultured marine thaumarchaeote KM3_70_D10]MCH1518840.1 hypothetical protein [Nitrosopumilus sp.]MDB4840737.1 hypothetical protein [Nitrosopumilus sp.]MDC0242668.1 hypothetical protein [Nitrosopumilus sp.]RCL30433.1 MAG: hypothetical protein DBX08_06695 [Nitrosopumilus sp.]